MWFYNRVPGRGAWRDWQIKYLHNCQLPLVITVMKCMRIRRVGHQGRMGCENTAEFQTRNSKKRDYHHTKIDLSKKKKSCLVLEWIYTARMGSKWRAVMDTIINYIFNSNKLYLLKNIYVYTILFYVVLPPTCLGCDVSQYHNIFYMERYMNSRL